MNFGAKYVFIQYVTLEALFGTDRILLSWIQVKKMALLLDMM